MNAVAATTSRRVVRVDARPADVRRRRRQADARDRPARARHARSVPDARRVPLGQRRRTIIAGFPNHPHRGFETVTYMLAGRMRHGDNQGNSGLLTPGSVQWMTAGPRHRAFGDARAGRRPDVGLPALGQPAGEGQDDRAALPGHRAGAHSRSRSRRTAFACACLPGRIGDVVGPVSGIAVAAALLRYRARAGRALRSADSRADTTRSPMCMRRSRHRSGGRGASHRTRRARGARSRRRRRAVRRRRGTPRD